MRAVFARPPFRMTARDFAFHPAPKGEGSAAQWVIANFQRAMQLARARKHQRRLGVIIVIDGDNEGVARRKQAMFQSVTEKREELPVAIWVPTRNIESWVQYLGAPAGQGEAVNESDDFKNSVGRDWGRLLPLAVAQWQVDPSPSTLLSLADAYQ